MDCGIDKDKKSWNHINVYFNNDGEFLSNDFDSEYDEWDQNMCFDVEFPISVNLSDNPSLIYLICP